MKIKLLQYTILLSIIAQKFELSQGVDKYPIIIIFI